MRFELSSPLRQGQILHFVFDNWRLSGAHVLNASCVVRSSTVTTLHNNGVPDELIGRCGPLFNHVRCGGTGVTEYPAGAIYCNEANGWCGNTEEHRNAQPSTEYDFIAASETLVNNALFATPFGDENRPLSVDRALIMVEEKTTAKLIDILWASFSEDSLNRELANQCLQPIMMALREITDPTLASDTSADSIGFGYIVMFEGEQIAGS